MKPHRPFIPAWLNQAGLSQSEFRVFCCLLARADIKTGIAWPSAELIASDCCMARNTVWKSLRSLESRKLIEKVGKPFAGSNRYRPLVPIGANEAPNEGSSIGANEIPIEASSNRRKSNTPIGANRIRQSAQMGYREGITKEGVTIEGVTNRELPFSTPAFAEAWKQWQQHRREIRKKLTPLAESKQLRSLANMGEARAIAAIEHSIENGWQGIFEPKSTAGKPTKQPATVDIGRRGYKQNSNP